jgi:O-antigen/teichoic acid export membrane protein
MSSLRRKIKEIRCSITENSFYSGLQAIVALFTTFVVLRILVSEIGVESFGLWAILVSFLSLGRALDISGIGGLAYFVAKAQSKGDDTAVYIVTMALFSLTFGVAFATIVTLNINLVLSMVLRNGFGAEEVFIANLVLLNSLVFAPISLALASAVDGLKRSDLRAKIIIFSNVSLVGLVLVLVPKFGLSGYAVSLMIQNAIILMCSLKIITKNIPRLGASIKRINSQISFEILSYGLKLQVNNLAGMFSDPIVKYYLSQYAGLEKVGYFEMASKLVLGFRGIIVQMAYPLIPEFSDVNNNKCRLSDLLDKANKLLRLSSIMMIAAVLFASPIYSYFLLGGVVYELVITTVILAIGYAFNIFSISYYNLGVGKNVWRWNILAQMSVGVTVSFIGFVMGELFLFYEIVIAFSVGVLLASIFTVFGNARTMRRMNLL